MIHPTAKVSEEVNWKLPAQNTMAQLLAIYTNPQCHSAQRYKQTDRQTDDVIMPLIQCINTIG